MIGWENPLGLVGDAARDAAVRCLSFMAACWLGFSLAYFSAPSPHTGGWLPFSWAAPLIAPLTTPLVIPVAWFIGMGLGLAAGTGFIAYFILFALLIAQVRREEAAWSVYLAAVVVQACESARLFASLGTIHWARFVGLLILVTAGGAALWYWRHWAIRNRLLARSRRLAGLCDRCGYDLRGSVAAHSEFCPECGQPIPDTTTRIIENREKNREP